MQILWIYLVIDVVKVVLLLKEKCTRKEVWWFVLVRGLSMWYLVECFLYLWMRVETGKGWWSTIMLYPMGISRSTGRTMLRRGLTSLRGRRGDALVIISFDLLYCAFGSVSLFCLSWCVIFFLFCSSPEESSENLSEADFWPSPSHCAWADSEV